VIYVIQHGNTDARNDNLWQGQMLNVLSPLGVQQSCRASQYLIENGQPIDFMFSSDLPRALQTAEIINQYHNLQITLDSRLRDCGHGIFEGVKRNELSPEFMDKFWRNPHKYNAESREDLYNRVNEFVSEIKENYADKNIAIVTHRSVVNMIEYCLNFDHWDALKFDYNARKYAECQIVELSQKAVIA
jgi:probable phosphoglycerate mutase